MSVLTTFIVKKTQTWTEPKSGKDEPKLDCEFWTAGNRDTSVNRGSPIYHTYKRIPCEQSQFSSPTRKIDSAVFVFCFVQEFGRNKRFKPVFDVRGSFYTVNHC